MRQLGYVKNDEPLEMGTRRRREREKQRVQQADLVTDQSRRSAYITDRPWLQDLKHRGEYCPILPLPLILVYCTLLGTLNSAVPPSVTVS